VEKISAEDNQESLEQRLRAAEHSKHGSYDKRTHHLDAGGCGIYINRLILEDSPYLLQHAHNPVNWYAWGAEAFAAASAEDKPVFLSIGYSTCHWCHVMEVESFDNVQIAGLLNQNFICIKLDREQFPDIDEVYMTAVQIMAGHGGWPMSSFLFANGEPFYSGTYYPPQQFAHLLGQISEVWRTRRTDLEQSARRITQAINQILAGESKTASLNLPKIETDLLQILDREDRQFGGLHGAPKFPQEPLLLYFLDLATRYQNADAHGFCCRALDAMARGGIYDQAAGGFHRYSTDAQWLVPHFEKMLYNQSQLSLAYLQGWKLTGNKYFRRVLRQTLDYVLREMQLPDGGFYTATDADSEGEEGRYFVWHKAEIAEVLESQDLERFIKLYGVTEKGNFENANILCLENSLAQFTADHDIENPDHWLDRVLEKIRQRREKRIAPLRDDKLIVAWASAMANTLALAGHALSDGVYLEAAERALEFIWQNNFLGRQSMRRIFLNGNVSSSAQLEDYANLCQALITVFDTGQDSASLHKAVAVMEQALNLFWNHEDGGFYISPVLEHGPMLARSSNASDGAVLSATATALECLVALYERSALIDEDDSLAMFYRQKISDCISSVAPAISANAISHPSIVRAIRRYEQGSTGAIQYAGNGRLRVEAICTENDTSSQLEMHMQLHPDWHLAAVDNNEGIVQPPVLALTESAGSLRIAKTRYPAAEDSGNSYRGQFVLTALLEKSEDCQSDFASTAAVSLTVQLCSDAVCLAAETLNFRVLIRDC
jgi:uncharacterized protein